MSPYRTPHKPLNGSLYGGGTGATCRFCGERIMFGRTPGEDAASWRVGGSGTTCAAAPTEATEADLYRTAQDTRESTTDRAAARAEIERRRRAEANMVGGLFACHRSRANYVEPCDDCPGCPRVPAR